MRKVISLALLVCFGLTAVGCKPTIDASSKESLETSSKKVKESLPADKQAKFDAALAVIVMKNGFEAMSGGANQADAEKKMKDALNGKTGDEIIAEAEKLDPNFAKMMK